MWKLYQTAKTIASRPSDMMCIEDRLAAYLFDSAVVTLGTIVENAAQELHNVGIDKAPKWEAKYKLSQLLDDKFRLPTPPTQRDHSRDSIAALRSMARKASQ